MATPPSSAGFGGSALTQNRSVDLSPRARYERVDLPRDDDAWGLDEEAIDEDGRSVLSAVTVQRLGANAARVGVRVDGGARFHVGREGRDRLRLTLLDTRAQDLQVRRTLDARSLGTPVLRVMPSVEEGRRFRVTLIVETRGAVPARIEQDGQMLWLEVHE